MFHSFRFHVFTPLTHTNTQVITNCEEVCHNCTMYITVRYFKAENRSANVGPNALSFSMTSTTEAPQHWLPGPLQDATNKLQKINRSQNGLQVRKCIYYGGESWVLSQGLSGVSTQATFPLKGERSQGHRQRNVPAQTAQGHNSRAHLQHSTQCSASCPRLVTVMTFTSCIGTYTTEANRLSRNRKNPFA